MSHAQPRTVRSGPVFDRFTFIILAVALVIGSAAAYMAFQWAKDFFVSWTITQIPGIPIVDQSKQTSVPTSPVVNETNPIDPSSPAISVEATPVPWDGSSRVTVLIMGLDYRDWSEGRDVPRTDSMILLSVDPLAKTASMMSIPRDLWVAIPGMQNNKINTAYRWGEIYKLPDGPTLAMKTVEGVTGVPIQYYALIDFNAFVQFIDSMGGLDMKIRTPITIDPIGQGNTKTLEVGTQTLTGAETLAYARQRHTANDDFDRSARQQEVIMAIRKQVLTLNMMPDMIRKAPELYSEISSGIRTNLTLDQVIRLAWLGSQIKEENIHKGNFDPHLDVDYGQVMTPDGMQDILIPRYDQIRLLVEDVFAISGPVSPATLNSDPAELMKEEAAKVRVLNGTGGAGMAAEAASSLQAQGVNVTGEGNADQVYGKTTIVLYTGKPYSVNFVIQQLGIDSPYILNKFDPNSPVDFDVILGQDWAVTHK